MQNPMMSTGCHRGSLALLLAVLVLITGFLTVGGHHDHAAGHETGCPTCRLADDATGALPGPTATQGILLPAAPAPFVAPEGAPVPVVARGANQLRAPPTA
ncbi:MAG: hypothetical protein SGI90_15155 [Candidatus Eisenbacteria bacterium]|nr:hypothetical protein [Candidatus Eisenbacteria bacterium]